MLRSRLQHGARPDGRADHGDPPHAFRWQCAGNREYHLLRLEAAAADRLEQGDRVPDGGGRIRTCEG
jgi:hypothetical protein